MAIIRSVSGLFKEKKLFQLTFKKMVRKGKENTKYYYITNFELKSNLENVISLQFFAF